MLCAAKSAVAIVGLGLSIFYGCNAVEIFVPESDGFVQKKTTYPSWRIHQWWFNFMGSAVGWSATYYFIFYRFIPLCCFTPKKSDAAIILTALLGIAGFLPLTLSLIPRTLGSLVSLVKKE
jgi:hypothetical protein